jgi:Mg-chelatase subunit ChlD
MTFAAPAGLVLLALAVPVVLLHVLRPRRPEVVVGSTYLWQPLSQPVSAASPWQKLRPSVLLLLQLLAVILLATAVARPVRLTAAPLARHTVFIVDASGSMAALDGTPDRLAAARDQAEELHDQLPAGGLASVVLASAQPRVLLSASNDGGAFTEALAAIPPPSGQADFAGAFTLAESLETPGVPIGFVFLSDGGLTAAERRLLPPGTRYERIGDRSANRAITRLAVEPRGSGLHALVTLRNTGGPAATQRLRLDVDGRTQHTEEVRLPEGGLVERAVDLPSGERVEAFLEGDDLLAADNHAFAAAAPRPNLRILLAGPEDLFLERLLAAVPGVTVERSETARPAPGADLAVYDGVPVPADPAAPWLAIAPPGGAPGVVITGEVETPAVALVRSEHPLLAGLDLSEVGLATAQRIKPAGDDEVLVGSEETPLLVRGSRGGRAFAYLGFRLADSNLPLSVAFPVLFDRLLTDLAGAAPPPTDLRAGQPLPIPQGAATTVFRPGGTRVDVPAGGSAPLADRTGFYRLRPAGSAAGDPAGSGDSTDDGSGAGAAGSEGSGAADDDSGAGAAADKEAGGGTLARPETVVAVNAPEAESKLAPAERIPVRPRTAAPGERIPRGEVPLLRWILLGLAAVLAAEYAVSRRTRGVPRKQWRAGVAARIAIALSLLGALLNVSLPRGGGGVATVFLVDASDSMGAAGREEALDWVREALSHQPNASRAGVVLFGGDARVEVTLAAQAQLNQAAVQVDATRTNLAGALRLAGALLPEDARRRVVLVSDGRATEGDAATEAKRLKEDGVDLDVHAVAGATGPDAAIARLDAPNLARKGESFVLRATVVATRAGAARLSLFREDTLLEERTVDLVAGDNVVEFPQTAGDPGLSRFRLEVDAPGDSVHANDTGFAAVSVDGPAKVLVAEGAQGNGTSLANALRAGGLLVDVVKAPELPALDRLSTYSATVLVDVDARSLSGEQVAALGAATRDLGRGLVVLGGDRSYALGGYRDSELEKLLPVISDIKDPKRRQSVAEVLAIDSSGSMAACHCRDGNNGIASGNNFLDGGVNKTDISRAAAARAVEALGPEDQVGVLAFNTEQAFVVPLQKNPSPEEVEKKLRTLSPAGGTDLRQPLQTAAAELRKAQASLKHIVLFTDGFTDQGGLHVLADQARALAEEGITVSVLATGEGASEELRKVAEAGRGRFYPGRDLSEVPQLMAQEVVLASRDFVNEGEFFPRVVGAGPAVENLAESPRLLGYLATTAKPTAETQLRVGAEDDPLLASWRVGLGRATAWTSDASTRWSKHWATWGGYTAFWTAVVKDTLPLGGAEGTAVAAEVDGERLTITAESDQPWPDGATATARVAGPDGSSTEVRLERVAGGRFAGEADATAPGSYSVGVSVDGPGGAVASGIALASQSYAPEYRPTPAKPDDLARLSRLSSGRGAIEAAAAFDRESLAAGHARRALAGLLLLLAALLWPLDCALRRLSFSAAPVVAAGRLLEGMRAAARRRLSALPLPGRDERGPVPGAAPGTLRRHRPGTPAAGTNGDGPGQPDGADVPAASSGEPPAGKDKVARRSGRGKSGQPPSGTDKVAAGSGSGSATLGRLLEKKRGSAPAGRDDESGG